MEADRPLSEPGERPRLRLAALAVVKKSLLKDRTRVWEAKGHVALITPTVPLTTPVSHRGQEKEDGKIIGGLNNRKPLDSDKKLQRSCGHCC